MAHSAPLHTYDYYIDEHGNWFCESNPVTDGQLFRVLSRSLFVRDGRYFVRCEGEVHPVRVADAPLWVHCIHAQVGGQGELTGVDIELRDGRRYPLAPETVRVVGNRALYCLATPRGLQARFGKLAYYEFATYLQWDDTDQHFYFILNGRRYDLLPDPAGRVEGDDEA